MQTFIIEQNDIMPGRGCGPNKHPGNIHFRSLVSSKAKAYTSFSTTAKEKKIIISEVIEDFENQPGRFLTRDDSGLLRVMSQSEKVAKVGQGIRDAEKRDASNRKVPRSNSIRCEDLTTAPSGKRSSLNASMLEVLMTSIDFDATLEDNDIPVDPNFIHHLDLKPQDLNKSQEEYFSRHHTFHSSETPKPFNPRQSAPPSYNSNFTSRPSHERKNNDNLLHPAVGQGEDAEAQQVQRGVDIHHQVQDKDDGKGGKVSRSNSICCEDLMPALSKSVGKRTSLNASMMDVLMMSMKSIDLDTIDDNDIEVDPNFIRQLDLRPPDLNKCQGEYFSQRPTFHLSETPIPFNPRQSAPPSYNYSDGDTKLSPSNHLDDKHQLNYQQDEVVSPPSLRHTISCIPSSNMNYVYPPSRCNSFYISSHPTNNDSKTSGDELLPDETYNQNHHDYGTSVFTDCSAISNLVTKQSYLEPQIPHSNNNDEAMNLTNNHALDQSMVFSGSFSDLENDLFLL